MDPIANALLGLVFVVTGACATVAMFYLRGTTPRSSAKAKPESDDEADRGTSDSPEEYLGAWRRSQDAREPAMDAIHAMAETGQSVVEPMCSERTTTSWDDLLILGAQLARLPLDEDKPVGTKTVIGAGAKKPLVVETPVLVSHMSFGALSREVKRALSQGSAAVKTAICSGEGGILPEELDAAYRYLFEYVPNRYSVTEENLRRVDAVELKIGQSAKPGMGGYLPGSKVTAEIAAVRDRPQGQAITSPATFDDIRTADDLRRKVDWLRETSGGRPVGVKLAAGHLEADLEFALAAGPDFVTIDGRRGATGAAMKVVKDATSVPTMLALARTRAILDRHGDQNIGLIVTGGFRTSSEVAKALALGADAVAMATAALMAAGCQQYRICHTGRCPVGITSQDPELRGRLDVDKSAQRVENFLGALTEELKAFARLTGHDDVHQLCPEDLCATSTELAQRLGVPRA